MSSNKQSPVTDNAWRTLRRHTDARIGLGRAGVSLPTSELLSFQLAHAQARDAVHFPLNLDQLTIDLGRLEHTAALGNPIELHSRADDRFIYLQRPDLGKQLSDASKKKLRDRTRSDAIQFDIAIVVADGLSSVAIQNHAAPFLNHFIENMGKLHLKWKLAPLTVVQQGRVAVGDEVAAILNARMVVLVIGERPGLSSPDSLGIYLSFNPQKGMTDAQRNCISNVRPAGLSFEDASQRLRYLIGEADRRKLSGVGLKDRSEDLLIEGSSFRPVI